jgi:hypothetical protein
MITSVQVEEMKPMFSTKYVYTCNFIPVS